MPKFVICKDKQKLYFIRIHSVLILPQNIIIIIIENNFYVKQFIK